MIIPLGVLARKFSLSRRRFRFIFDIENSNLHNSKNRRGPAFDRNDPIYEPSKNETASPKSETENDQEKELLLQDSYFLSQRKK